MAPWRQGTWAPGSPSMGPFFLSSAVRRPWSILQAYFLRVGLYVDGVGVAGWAREPGRRIRPEGDLRFRQPRRGDRRALEGGSGRVFGARLRRGCGRVAAVVPAARCA